MQLTVVILGAGESGVGAALLAKAKGFDVFLSDKGNIQENYCQILTENDIAFESGKHTIEKLSSASLIVKSPGIPGNIPVLQELKNYGIPVISEIEFASRYTSAKIIAITGTNGKTTTTLLTYHLLKDSGFNVGIGGNIGNSFAAMVIEDTHDYYVLEISSFQLDDIEQFKPHISVLLNVTPDHLDRYDHSFEKYLLAKFKITKNQDLNDLFIYGGDIPAVKEEANKLSGKIQLLETRVNTHQNNGGWTESNALVYKVEEEISNRVSLVDFPLYGKHNQLNALTATLIAVKLGVKKEKIEHSLKSFKNAAHRMEFVGEFKGVTYLNDSKATNVDAVYYALDGVKEKIIWIAGGVDKGNEYEQIASLVKQKVEHMICLGTDNKNLVQYFGEIVPSYVEVESMQDAVWKASQKAQSGQVVLLSPACASFDLFNNYIDRGDQFREEVRKFKTADKKQESL